MLGRVVAYLTTPTRMRNMTDQTPQQTQTVLGEVQPMALQRLAGLKQQADQVVHQIGVNRVQEHRLIDQLRQLENATNQIVMEEGKRLNIPEGTAWSVTSEGKAVQVGPSPMTITQPKAPAAPPIGLVPEPEPADADEAPELSEG